MAASGLAFGFYVLLLSILPQTMMQRGASEPQAGAVTSVFMGFTVVFQILTPRLLRRVGFAPLITVAIALLGLPCLGFLATVEFWPVSALSAVRGAGFGLLTVAQTGLVAEMVPTRLMGRTYAVLGAYIGLAQIVAFPLAGWIFQRWGFEEVVLTAVALCGISLVCMIRVPGYRYGKHMQQRPAASAPGETPGGTAKTIGDERRASSRRPFEVDLFLNGDYWKRTWVPAFALASGAMVFGLLSTFTLSAVESVMPNRSAVFATLVLSVSGVGGIIFRYAAGIINDRRGAGATLVPGLILGVVGLAAMAWAFTGPGTAHEVAALIGAFLYGASFNMVQNDTLLLYYQRLPERSAAEASALWNVAYDGGTGIGAYFFGAIIAWWFYPPAFAIAAGIVFLALVFLGIEAVVRGSRRQPAEVY